MTNFWKKEDGVMMVEETIVYPIVIICVCLVIFMGMYELQGVITYSRAQFIADQTAKMYQDCDYGKYGVMEPGKTDFSQLISEINTSTGEGGAWDHDLYYRWRQSGRDTLILPAGQTSYESVNILDHMQGQLEAYLDKTIVFKSERSIDFDYNDKLLYAVVRVEVTDSIKVPKFLKYIGIPTDWSRTTVATAVASDATQFVRTTDLVRDCVKKLLERFGLMDKVNVVFDKLNNLLDKFGLGEDE